MLLADEDAVTNGIDGRDYEGQISIDINDTTYILIGNEQQLRAIGTGTRAHGRVYHYLPGQSVDASDEYYAGDADLSSGEELFAKKFDDLRTEALHYFCGQNSSGEPDKKVTANPDLYYTADANYIIFRDIDLNTQVAGEPDDGSWTPIMFSGVMLGVDMTGDAQGTLSNPNSDLFASATELTNAAQAPTISNVAVSTSGKLDTRAYAGIGFFGTITTQINLEDLGKPARTTVVSNLALDKVDVSNTAVEAEETATLVDGLTGILSGLLNGVVGGLVSGVDGLLKLLENIPGLGILIKALREVLTDQDTGVLGNLLDVLTNVLDLRKTDPTIFATGAFVGRIVGDVNVNRCTVTQATVENAATPDDSQDYVYVGMTGGFAGYIEGQTKYDGLSQGLDIATNGLQALLNIVPGLGLGDLLELLKDKGAISLDQLIPTGYYNPVISGCSVSLNDDSIGTADTSYAGGFAGVQIGAIIEHSSVEAKRPLTITAERFAGGFAGLMRDAEMEGLLNNLGVQLIEVGQPQSLALGSSVAAPSLTVTANDHAGGFTGTLAASYIVASKVNVKVALDVSATAVEAAPYAGFAGGMVGEATLGWATNLGFDDDDQDVIGLLSTALSKVLGSDNSGELLTLMGFTPAAIMDSAVSAVELTVHSETSYAGGLVGHGEGTLIDAATQTNLEKLSHWKSGGRYAGQAAPSTPNADASNSISGLSLVTAKDSYAGGIAGMLETAAVGGLLNDLLGVGDVPTVEGLGGNGFNAFRLAHTTVNKQADGAAAQPAYAVVAGGLSAGGAVGSASGGSIEGIAIDSVASVIGAGEVGGFIGQAASGSLVGTKGVNILGLVKVSGLLSVAQYSALTVTDCSVTGRTPAKGAGPKVEEAPKLETDPSRQTTADAGLLPANQSPYLTVIATGANQGEASQITAGGFFGRASSLEADRCTVNSLGLVQAPEKNGNAGGFVGLSTTGGLASIVADDDGGVDASLLEDILGGKLLNISDLLGAVPWMIPEYRETHTDYLDGGWVTADIAGGYAGLFESGSVNVFDKDNPVSDGTDVPSLYAVNNIAAVRGTSYAGGFGGKVVSGSLAKTGGGLSLLGDAAGINLDGLLGVIQAYVPTIKYADVLSENGFTVTAAQIDSQEQTTSGAAGGFIGYGTAVQVSYSDVSKLAHTTVTPPDDLEAKDALSYFDSTKSTYAVTAPQYAGGYFGYLNIGSTAGVASGLELLKNLPLDDGSTRGISVSDLTSALNVMASTVEHSNVYGHAGGFSVLASGTDSFDAVGHAGGFAGKVSGGQIQDCNVDNFAYIIGQIAAGGYAGEIEPGSVADVLGEATTGEGGILDGLLEVDNLASLAQAFVPTIRNSQTTCVPCGGAVRAQALTTEEGGADGSDTKVTVQRGMAGGYVGHSVGGQIWGNSSSLWKDEVDDDGNYTGMKREAAAIRIRSVYGAEYAGGFTGLMESGDTASAGGLNLLWGLVTVHNLLSALSVVYPTEENTAVYGPLRGLSAEEWNSWVDYVGIHGGYGSSLAGAAGKVDPNAPDDEVAAMLAEYVYGTHVVAGRQTYESVAAGGGAAGGYVGSMVTGTITNGKAYDTKLVRAMRAAGGFAGAAEAGAAATLGSVGLLNGVLAINLNELLSAAQIFVPVIKNSSVEGYRLGMTVESSGSGSQSDDATNATGNAGGYIGYGAGAQIWGDGSTSSEGESDDKTARGCNVSGLRRVSAAAYAGGFAGKLTAGAAAKLNTDNASDGFLQQVLDALVGSAGLSDLVSVLKLSMSVVRGTTVTGFDEAWGYTVESYRDGSYPIAAGGYAGAVEATVLGKLDNGADSLAANHVERLRGVDGGYYAGGFVGLADVGGVADVASGSTEGSNVSILGLVGLNNVGVLQVFQPCIYGAGVIGVSDGVTVRAHNADSGSMLNNKRSSGNAGGFAGSVMSGTVQDSSVTNLNSVSAPSYTGGFIGYTGKSGVLDAEEADIASILGLSAEVINLFSTIVKNDMVTGIAAGYTVSSSRDALSDEEDSASDVQPISGGFIGFADLAHVTGCSAINLKRVGSDEIAGGFAGKTTFDYLVKLETNSPLVAGLLVAVNAIVEALRLDKLQNLGVIKINLGGEKFIEVGVLAEGNVAKISLFGLTIRIALSKESGPNREDVVTITIGDSSVKLTCDKEGNISKEDISNLTVNLIKANRAEITHSTVTGIADGYDVFGGGASQDGEAPHDGSGYAGGFVGHNDEGKLQGNEMVLADVVKGAANKTGTFTGVTSYSSNWWFNDVADVETGNTYHVYRDASLVGASVENIAADLTVGNAVSANAWARFDVTKHVPNANESNLADWQNATAAKEGAEAQALGVMASASKAVLMADAEVTDNTGGLTPEPEDGQDPCESSIDLTLQKIWDDGIFGLVRPSKVEFVLYATYTDEDGVHTLYYDQDLGALVDEESLQVDSEGKPIKPTVTVTKEDAESLWSSTWREVIESLPVATEEGHYYTYYVDEVDVAGYESQVTADHEEQVFTVTNKFTGMPLLPGTGGIGTTLIVAVGLATLVLGGVWLDQQRRRRNPPRAYAGAHFANAAPNTRRASKWVSKLHQKERMKRCKR